MEMEIRLIFLRSLHFFPVCQVLQIFLNKEDKIYISLANQTYSHVSSVILSQIFWCTI